MLRVVVRPAQPQRGLVHMSIFRGLFLYAMKTEKQSFGSIARFAYPLIAPTDNHFSRLIFAWFTYRDARGARACVRAVAGQTY